MAERFKRITLNGWRQFESVDIEFAQNVTVLTGANGAGKTTILNILGRHFGWNVGFVSTPIWRSALRKVLWTDLWSALTGTGEPDSESQTVGHIVYSGGADCVIDAPTITSAQYQLDLRKQQAVEGLNIPSHRPAIVYSDVGSISTRPPNWSDDFNEYQNLLLQTYTHGGQNPGVVIKRSLVSLAVFGYGNQAVAPNDELRRLYENFQTKLRQILPQSLGFEKLEVRMPDVVLATKTGDFSLDAMSGGIASLLGITWQIYMFGWNKDKFTILIDEPENHLHPSMQREILPSLAAAFPNCQFIVSTHSPLIVSSDPNASVYALIFNEKNRVTSHKLTEADLSGSANEILREILDIQTSVPIWVEKKLHSLLQQLAASDTLSAEAVYAEIKRQGLEKSLGEYAQKREKPN